MKKKMIWILGVAVVSALGATGVFAQGAPAPAPAPAAAPADTITGPFVSDVKIVVDNKAKSDGELRLKVEPQGGTVKEVKVSILKGMGKQEVCRDLAKELKVALGDAFKVDQYDNDKVEIEPKGDAKLRVAITSQTASGLSVMLK